MILEGFICEQPQSCVGQRSALQVPCQFNITIPAGRRGLGLPPHRGLSPQIGDGQPLEEGTFYETKQSKNPANLC